MERLTHRDDKGMACIGFGGLAPTAYESKAAIDRLAAYEDTGLTPERAAELAQAERDGRLVVLPCKIGDVVWGIKNFKGHKRVRVGYVSEMHYTKDMKLYIVVKGLSRGFWGEDVFATQEEADAAVERREEPT